MGNVADDSAGTIYAGKDLSLINSTVYPNIIKDDKPIVGKGKVKIIDSSLPGNLYCLQLLIDSAKEGSTLNLNSNYATIKDKLIIIINKSIVIDGHGHTIDLAGDSKHDHYFKVTDGSVTFKNIRFINGFNKDDDKGGAIFFKSLKKCNIINCTFEKCFAEKQGGAVYSNGDLCIYNSTFLYNRANYGGAMYGGSVYNCTFKNNSAYLDGGAMYGGAAYNSTFDSNIANFYDGRIGGNGGAIFGGDAYNCTFKNNIAHRDGGAIDKGNAFNCTFIRNSAQFGGGIDGGNAYNCTFISNSGYVWSGAMTHGDAYNCTFKNNEGYDTGAMNGGTAWNCTFIGNRAQNNGGGMNGGTACNCTFINNTSVYCSYGGGISCSNACNCTFINNTAIWGDAMYQSNARNCTFFCNFKSKIKVMFESSCDDDCQFIDLGNDSS